MPDWIDFAQMFLITEPEQPHYWQYAIDACTDPELKECLEDWPFETPKTMQKAKQLMKRLNLHSRKIEALMLDVITRYVSLCGEAGVQGLKGKQALMFRKLSEHRRLHPLAAMMRIFEAREDLLANRRKTAERGIHIADKYFNEAISSLKHDKRWLTVQAVYAKNVTSLCEQFNLTALAQKYCEHYLSLICTKPLSLSIEQAERVSTLNMLGSIQWMGGHFDSAAQSYEQTLELLHDKRKNYGSDWSEDLAMTLGNQANLYFDCAEFELALEKYQESLEIYQQLEEHKPGEYVDDLARMSGNLSVLYHELGDWRQATELGNKALQLRKVQLETADEEDQADVKSELAKVRLNLGNLSIDCGQEAQAVEQLELAVAQFSDLTDAQPGIYEPDLALASLNLGGTLFEMGHYRKAEVLLASARKIYLKLMQTSEGHQANLSAALVNLARVMFAQNRMTAAKNRIEEAVNYLESLHEVYPQAYFDDLSNALLVYASIQEERGEVTQSNELARSALSMLDENQFSDMSPYAETQVRCHLFLAQSGSTDSEEHIQEVKTLLTQHKELGADWALPIQAEVLNIQLTLASYKEQYEPVKVLFDELMALPEPSDPNSINLLLKEKARANETFSAVLSLHHRYTEALAASDKAITLYRKILHNSPGSFIHELASALNSRSQSMVERFEFNMAQDALSESLALLRPMVDEEPEGYLQPLVTALNSQAILLRAQREPGQAMVVAEEVLIQAQRLANIRSELLDGVALAHMNLAGDFEDAVNLSQARFHYQQALSIYMKINRQGKNDNQDDLAECLFNIAGVFQDEGDYPRAAHALEEAVAYLQPLYQQAPQIHAPALARLRNRQANMLDEQERYDESIVFYQQAIDLARESMNADPQGQLKPLLIYLSNLSTTLILGKTSSETALACQLAEEAVQLAEGQPLDSRALAKASAHYAYTVLLHQAVVNNNPNRAFALFAALFDEEVCIDRLYSNALDDTRQWLAYSPQGPGCLLLAVMPLDELAVLGLITPEQTLFDIVDASGWDKLAQKQGSARRQAAADIWFTLSLEFRQVLNPQNRMINWVGVSCDDLASVLPFELLRFGDGCNDCLGLHYALPRIRGIVKEQLDKQLTPSTRPNTKPIAAINAPYDTRAILSGAEQEVARVEQCLFEKQVKLLEPAIKQQATFDTICSQLATHPDIFYFCGHGAVYRGEEVLLLNGTPSSFGNSQLHILEREYQGSLFTHGPIYIFNCCFSGTKRGAGGRGEDLTATLLSKGVSAVIASGHELNNQIGSHFGQALFDPTVATDSNIGEVLLQVRRHLAVEYCNGIDNPLWGCWGMYQLFGNSNAYCPWA